MSWTAPRTWVVGETITASLFNTHIRDNELDIDSRLDTAESNITSLQTSITKTPQLVATDDTEHTTTQTGTAATLKSFTGLSIPATNGIAVRFAFRKTTGAAASAVLFVSLNSSSPGTLEITNPTDAANAAGNGFAYFEFPPYESANYDDAGSGYSNFKSTSGETYDNVSQLLPRPSSTITQVDIQGLVSSASITLGVMGIRVWSLP